ncbi:MAG: 3-phosphoshikimate 1-carboxyvinyltransferase, partial [Lachnospiraceae bacterium]|nr:3-phosphoshikimate 1-carboxyvinyltransferase [Lachnospiraceae bacterium]
MEHRAISKTRTIHGDISVPGDKSISHRGVMLGAIATGTTRLLGFLDGADCRSTIDCFRRLGIAIEIDKEEVRIEGKGLGGLSAPETTLDVGNSGTTLRLISGILAAAPFRTVLTGDASIQKRPMRRIIDPLTKMGAHITSVRQNDCAPLEIEGALLSGMTYTTPVASAQVKSCILLAGLSASGETKVIEPAISRDHTERMLAAFGADIIVEKNTTLLRPGQTLRGQEIHIPGDISSAAPFLAAGLLAPEGELLLRNVNTNPTRAGLLSVIQEMGGKLTRSHEHRSSQEEVADLLVSSS